MRCYYYGPPSKTLLRAAFKVRSKAMWLRWPTAAVLVISWALVMPSAWLLVKAGEIGHALAGWCGFESRDW